MWWQPSVQSTLLSAKSTARGLVIKQFVIGNFLVPTPRRSCGKRQTAMTMEVTEDTEDTHLGQALHDHEGYRGHKPRPGTADNRGHRGQRTQRHKSRPGHCVTRAVTEDTNLG